MRSGALLATRWLSLHLQEMSSLAPSTLRRISGHASQSVINVSHLIDIAKRALHKSTVVSVRFDPLSGRVVATASTDGKCMVTTCFFEETDTVATGPFAGVNTYGETLFSFTVIGWVNTVQFSPDATTLSYSTHDCEVNFVDISS